MSGLRCPLTSLSASLKIPHHVDIEASDIEAKRQDGRKEELGDLFRHATSASSNHLFQPRNFFPRSIFILNTTQVILIQERFPHAPVAEHMSFGPMRKLSSPSASFLRWKSLIIHTHSLIVAPTPALRQLPQSRNLAQVRSEPFSELWFTPSSPGRGPADELLGPPAGNGSDHKPPDERTLKLGKSELAAI